MTVSFPRIVEVSAIRSSYGKRRLFDPEFVREGAVRTVRETRKPITQDWYSGRRFPSPAGTCGVSPVLGHAEGDQDLALSGEVLQGG